MVILLIDDHPQIGQSLQAILTLVGYEVQLAANAHQGLAWMNMTKPSLIIADILLPDMDGLQLFQHVRRRDQWQSIPFIFISGDPEKLPTIRTQSFPNVIACLSKPFAIQDLLDAVEQATSARSSS